MVNQKEKALIVWVTLCLLASVSVAYNSSLTLSNDTITGEELPDRFFDVVGYTGSKAATTLGVTSGDWVSMLLWLGIIVTGLYIIKRFVW